MDHLKKKEYRDEDWWLFVDSRKSHASYVCGIAVLDNDGQWFTYIGQTFPTISDSQLKQGVFDGPQILTLFKDTKFVT